ncbi:MAG: hypothetical protein M3308_01855 [Actinomycetota bacterium]|nr:hypothetical protein [Actinomycetota bacterium]
MTTTTPDSPESTADGVVVGVVADPVAAPAFIAQRIEHDLPGLLAEQMPGRAWRVEVVLEQLPPSDSCHSEMMEFATERMQQHGWDVAVCVTDLPLVSGKQPVVADASNSRQVAVVSLPAFGAMALHRRVRGVVIQLIADLRGEGAPGENTEEHRRRRLPALGRAFRRVTPDQEGIDLRILASRGRLRLLIGMVRDNQPWRLVFGLRGALVGAFAFSAFYLLNTTVWELALTMAPLQRLATVLGSLAVLVTWLIIYHHLWERTRNRPAQEREQAVLFNASTVLTLAIGLACGYVALYILNLTAAVILFTPEVFSQYTGPDPGAGDYATVVLLVTAAATIAGAIGSGFDSEDSVREAAYSYRERERREALRRSQ